MPAITTSPTSTSRSMTVPSMGARISVRSTSCSLLRRMAKLSFNSCSLISSAASILAKIVSPSRTSLGEEKPRASSFSITGGIKLRFIQVGLSQFDGRFQTVRFALPWKPDEHSRPRQSSRTSRSPRLDAIPSSH